MDNANNDNLRKFQRGMQSRLDKDQQFGPLTEEEYCGLREAVDSLTGEQLKKLYEGSEGDPDDAVDQITAVPESIGINQ